ncbi:amidase domain-containing protein [Agromyces silvae]|uniref:amidase domain-containing protein n=1 Tax=Agromyces silvae TaxID=3388266 RepID=UPI00280AE931|nr:amidase domain-containing protein [Agromyces protaetiae]
MFGETAARRSEAPDAAETHANESRAAAEAPAVPLSPAKPDPRMIGDVPAPASPAVPASPERGGGARTGRRASADPIDVRAPERRSQRTGRRRAAAEPSAPPASRVDGASAPPEAPQPEARLAEPAVPETGPIELAVSEAAPPTAPPFTAAAPETGPAELAVPEAAPPTAPPFTAAAPEARPAEPAASDTAPPTTAVPETAPAEPAMPMAGLAEPGVPETGPTEPAVPEAVRTTAAVPKTAPTEPTAPEARPAEPAGSAARNETVFPWRLTPEAPVDVPDGRAPAEEQAPRRGRGRGRRRLVVGASAAALLVVTGLGALAVVNDVPASLFDVSAANDPAQPDALAGAASPAITSDLSEPAAPFTGGTSVSVTGERLDEVTQVSVGGAPATILEASADQLTFAVPATTDDAIGAAEVVFADADGRPVKVAVPASGAAASAEASAGSSSEPEAADGASASDSLTLTYTTDPGIDAQLAYVLAHWDDYNTAEYPAVPGKDAVNFASQALIARGWTMDDAWNVDPSTGAMSAAWSSSTALREYLLTRTDRATELTDAQRDQVKAGDLAQFDWDDSGDRDHTAVVTRVERTDAGTKVWVASHTKDADYWDVDAALASGGGSVSWFSIR